MEDNKNQKPAMQISSLREFNALMASDNTKKYVKDVLANKADQFVNNITALVGNSANLQRCTPLTILYAGIKATALDLPLDQNLGFAYVIPYENKSKGIVEAQFQLGYRAFIQLAIRSGQMKAVNVTEVREGELVGIELLSGEVILERAKDRQQLPVIGYAAYFRLLNGFEKTLYISKDEMELHANTYSQTYKSKYENVRNSSMWATDFDKMAKKTVLKNLLKNYAPLSVDMQQALTFDQAVINGDNSITYVDNSEIDTFTEVQDEIASDANFKEININMQPADEQPAKTSAASRKPSFG